jgi:hypothetical protein
MFSTESSSGSWNRWPSSTEGKGSNSNSVMAGSRQEASWLNRDKQRVAATRSRAVVNHSTHTSSLPLNIFLTRTYMLVGALDESSD